MLLLQEMVRVTLLLQVYLPGLLLLLALPAEGVVMVVVVEVQLQ